MDPVIDAQTHAIFEERAKTLTTTVGAAQLNGDIAASTDARKLSMFLLVALRGVGKHGRVP